MGCALLFCLSSFCLVPNVVCVSGLSILDCVFCFQTLSIIICLASAALEIKKIEGLVSVLELCAIHKEIFKKCINIYFSLNFRVNCTYTTYWAYPQVDA